MLQFWILTWRSATLLRNVETEYGKKRTISFLNHTLAFMLCAILISLSLAPHVRAQGINFDAASSAVNSTATTNTLSWSHTTSGSDRILIVGVSIRNESSETVSTVTYGTGNLTFVGAATNGTACRAEIWQLVNPATGANTVTVTLSAGSKFVGGAVTFTGVHQTTPFGTFVPATGTSITPSVNVTSAAAEAVIDTLAQRNSATTAAADSSQTGRWNDVTSGAGGTATNVRGAGSTEPGAASVTMSWTLSSSRPWAIGAVSLKPSNPTAIKLTSFTATGGDHGPVLLQWRTGYEVDNLGFHVYRQEGEKLFRLTPELIAGSALLTGPGTQLSSGRSYAWWDTSVPSSQSSSLNTFRYWLEDWDLNGKRTMRGPAEVKPSAISDGRHDQGDAGFLSQLGRKVQEKYDEFWEIEELRNRLHQKPAHKKTAEIPGYQDGSVLSTRDIRFFEGPQGDEPIVSTRPQTTRQSLSPQAERELQWSLASKPAVKLLVKEEGWYRVAQPELVAAGLDPGVNPRRLQLFVDGHEQPIGVTGEEDTQFDPEDAVEFYGVGLDTPFTDTRTYWLIAGEHPGSRIKTRKADVGGKPGFASSSFRFAVELKERTVYFPALKNGQAENFFGPVLATEPVDKIMTLSNLDPTPPGEALLEVALQGVTNVSHRVTILLNDTEVGELVFDGQAHDLAKVPIPQSDLLEGYNLVTLASEGDETDVTLIDYIRITYRHTYTADNDALKFTAPGGRTLSLKGFTNPNIRVVDITKPEAAFETSGTTELQETGYAATFKVPGTGIRTLLAFTDNKVKKPAGIVANEPSTWHRSQPGYDFVIITYKDFLENLTPLRGLRESQGMSVSLVDVEDVYDEFNFGMRSPQALQDFLLRTTRRWERFPRFVLLVGDASADPRNYLGFGDFELVPTKLLETAFFETASDDWLVDFNGDGLPDMAIGRLPVRTAQEAATVVSKILEYEQLSGMSEALLVADKVDPEDFDFESASLGIKALLPGDILVSEIFRGQFASDGEVRSEILDRLNHGALIANYIGHGSTEVWRGDIFSSDDARTLTNGSALPFVMSMTCLNGLFQDLYTESLAESLLKAEQGGAIAVWASSGMTQPEPQTAMNGELVRLLFNGEGLTLGEAAALAKTSVADQEVRRTWILFGDPATKLKY
jgi:hypothetical protein